MRGTWQETEGVGLQHTIFLACCGVGWGCWINELDWMADSVEVLIEAVVDSWAGLWASLRENERSVPSPFAVCLDEGRDMVVETMQVVFFRWIVL